MQEDSQYIMSSTQLEADIGQTKQENGTPGKKNSRFLHNNLKELCFLNSHEHLDLVSKHL